MEYLTPLSWASAVMLTVVGFILTIHAVHRFCIDDEFAWSQVITPFVVLATVFFYTYAASHPVQLW